MEEKMGCGIEVGQVRKWKIKRWGTEPFTILESVDCPNGLKGWTIINKGKRITVEENDLFVESFLV
jgi:hypothetical protein